jgi:succinoglycan biosynthesis protein ExoA
MKPYVSVLIPCRNEAVFLAACLDSILAGDYPADRMEVLVADGMSEDGTREIIGEYALRDTRVRLLDNPRRTTPAALNRAIGEARGEVLARIDAHASVAPDYLSRCVGCLESSGADNVGGSMRTVARTRGPFADAIVAALTHRFGVGNSHFRIGSAEPRWVDTVFGGCWRRDVFERVGRFNEALERSQDMEFSLRLKAAGGKTLLAPAIRADYFARSDLASFWRHNFANGEWAVLPWVLSDAIPVRIRHLVPLAFVGALGLGLALAPISPLPLVAVAIPYALANAAASIWAAWRDRRMSHLIRLPIAFAALHFGYGLGSVSGVVQAFRHRALHKQRPCQPQP